MPRLRHSGPATVGRHYRGLHPGLLHLQRQPNRERAAAAQRAGYGDVAPHEPAEPPAESEPQSRPAVATAGGRLGLRELLKQSRDLLLGQADPRIRDVEDDHLLSVARLLADRERYRTPLGE